MKLSILLRTQEFRGDHSADVLQAHDLLEGETVEALAGRLLQDANKWADKFNNVIEIRLIKTESTR
ncbi:MAG TPA: hypothetical protein VN444_04015 [Verrucomicrobiae bacterium]|nr:hypothetical protein [Verrucomicrobiae bacterium]